MGLMAYITSSDIEERLGTRSLVQLTDDTGTGTVDADKVEEARLGSEGEVNSYLARRYSVPIDVAAHTELAGLLASITLDIAAFRLHCRRPPVPVEVTDRRDAALQWLGRVACGDVRLPADSELPGNEAEGPTAETTGHRRVLTEDEFQTW